MFALFLTLFIMNLPTHAQQSSSVEDIRWAGNLEMNGYSLKQYEDFSEKWKLVTVRYRMDSGEFRFIYANPLAWKTLSENKTDYPDGAVFAKTAYLLSTDKDFPSSHLPNKVARYQLMVKNSKAHKSTNGWGYALFNAEGKTFPGNPETVAQACNACHNIVLNKGSIFSSPVDFKINYFPSLNSHAAPNVPMNPYQLSFVDETPRKLSKSLSNHLPLGTKKVRSLNGSMRNHLFQGTLNEILPFLAMEAVKRGIPAALVSADGERFSAAYLDSSAKNKCQFGTREGRSVIFITTLTKAEIEKPAMAYAAVPPGQPEVVQQSSCFAVE